MRRDFTCLAVGYAILTAVILSMCACMGCATSGDDGDWFNDWVRNSPGLPSMAATAKHDDPSTWRPYQEYRAAACEICGDRDVNWAHELPRSLHPELVNDPDNGHTLCHTCHWFFHYQAPGLYWCADMDAVIEKMIKAKKRYGAKDGTTR